jgi:hypothetical protein
VHRNSLYETHYNALRRFLAGRGFTKLKLDLNLKEPKKVLLNLFEPNKSQIILGIYLMFRDAFQLMRVIGDE